MRVTRHGKIIPFCCPACGCEFVTGVNELLHYSERGRSRCECPDCGAIAIEPAEKKELEKGG